MRPEGLERFSRGFSPLHRLDARIKLIAALLLVVTIVLTPMGAWRTLGSLGLFLMFLIGLAGIPPREFGRRWLGLFVVVGFLAIMVAITHPAREHLGFAVVASSILLKNGLAILTMLLLAGVTPFPTLLRAMRKLGMPRILVSTLQFMDRYRHVLLEELDRMAVARRARTFNRRALPWSLLTGLIGMLFLRTFERAERVHDAMIARGWQGVYRNLDE
jgi:cobalt/nickel transport system permease protein